MIFDWDAPANWIPTLSATRLLLAPDLYWIDWSSIDWTDLPQGWLVR